jgi:TPR repeat protein
MKKQSVEALYDQGRRYLQGDGVVFSYEQGTEYLKKAADLGHAKAQYNLAVCLHLGTGIKQSYEEAYKYFQLASNQGLSRAHYMLGATLFLGSPSHRLKSKRYTILG